MSEKLRMQYSALFEKIRYFFSVKCLFHSEILMKPSLLMAPQLTANGVTFTLKVDNDFYDCLVPSETLELLSTSDSSSLELLQTYRSFESKINRIAERLVRQGVATSSPIVVEANYLSC